MPCLDYSMEAASTNARTKSSPMSVFTPSGFLMPSSLSAHLVSHQTPLEEIDQKELTPILIRLRMRSNIRHPTLAIRIQSRSNIAIARILSKDLCR